jgi:Holliday junction resolvasome RuvABC endonuclease subunit
MSSIIRVAAIDPSLRNFGLARLLLNLDDMSFHVEALKLIETEKDGAKQVRKSSDNLRRAEEITLEVHEWMKGATVCFAEIPSGAQSAAASHALGIALGICASIRISNVPLIQVQPTETKLHTVGTKTASKEEMIEWATEVFPKAPWLRKSGRVLAKNEHLADAVAIAHAGVKTTEFRQLMAMMRAERVAA